MASFIVIIVLRLSVRVPELKIPPPSAAVFSLTVVLLSVSSA